jgi:maltooligosyltrehalose trehalohydrolase
MVAFYRHLAQLRRRYPELTDPSFGTVTCQADEAARFFTMQRGRLLVLVNFGDQPLAAEIGVEELLFETVSGVDVADSVVRLPAHAGALVRLRRDSRV